MFCFVLFFCCFGARKREKKRKKVDKKRKKGEKREKREKKKKEKRKKGTKKRKQTPIESVRISEKIKVHKTFRRECTTFKGSFRVFPQTLQKFEASWRARTSKYRIRNVLHHIGKPSENLMLISFLLREEKRKIFKQRRSRENQVRKPKLPSSK